jgi:hypothetical protein
MSASNELKERWVSKAMRYAGVDCFYNSALDLPLGPNDNAVLTICLRIELVKMSAAAKGGVFHSVVESCSGKGGQPVQQPVFTRIQEWGETEWMLFRKDCYDQAKFWDNRFYLAPPLKYTGLDMKTATGRVRPHVECRFEPVMVSAGEGPHVRYEVARLSDDDSPGFRPGDPPPGGNEQRLNGVQDFTRASNLAMRPRAPALAKKAHVSVAAMGRAIDQRNDFGLLSSQSNKMHLGSRVDDKGQTWKTSHRGLVHELGHALGLPHSGVLWDDEGAKQAAKVNSNACSTYGLGGPAGALLNIMGAGDELLDFNALPWMHRVVMHLKTPTRPQDWLVAVLAKGAKPLPPRRL